MRAVDRAIDRAVDVCCRWGLQTEAVGRAVDDVNERGPSTVPCIWAIDRGHWCWSLFGLMTEAIDAGH